MTMAEAAEPSLPPLEGDPLLRAWRARGSPRLTSMWSVEGTSASALRAGAGHYPDTSLLCQSGNVAIAGHRTTYGRPFTTST